MKLLVIVNLLCLILETQPRIVHGILDTDGPARKTAYYQCMRASGFNKVILPSPYIGDDFVPRYLGNVQNALNAGLRLEIGLQPERCQPVENQVKIMKKMLELDYIDRVWVVVDMIDCPGKKFTAEENCQFFHDFLTTMKKEKIEGGALANLILWTIFFESETSCPSLSEFPLWWIPDEQDTPDFDNYVQIGGWKTPYMKCYDMAELCGQYVYLNYLP